MPTLTFSLFGTTGPARSRRIEAGERVNVYAETNPDPVSGKKYLVWYSRPGLDPWLALGASPVRGWHVMQNHLYALAGSQLYSIGPDQVATVVGSLPSAVGPVAMADNGVDLVLVDRTVGYRFTPPDGTVMRIDDFPGENAIACLGGFFASPSRSSAEVMASDFLSADTWRDGSSPQSDFARPKWVAASGELLYVFSPTTIESWYVTGEAYPFGPTQGAVLPWGLLASASVTRYQGGITALVGNKGEIHLGLLTGYDLTTLSDQSVERAWSDYRTVADAVASAWTADAHPFLAITFPTVGESWLYDGSSQTWARLSSGTDGGRFVGQYAVPFAGRTLVSDTATGTIYAVALDAGADGGEVFPCELVSQAVYLDGAAFVVPAIELHMETGHADLPLEPELIVQMADHGDWRPSRTVSMGRTGERWRRGRLTRCGQFGELTVKVRSVNRTRLVLERAILKVSA